MEDKILLGVSFFFVFMCIVLLSAMNRFNDDLQDEKTDKNITGGCLSGY